jgi:hypothetical protein
MRIEFYVIILFTINVIVNFFVLKYLINKPKKIVKGNVIYYNHFGKKKEIKNVNTHKNK